MEGAVSKESVTDENKSSAPSSLLTPEKSDVAVAVAYRSPLWASGFSFSDSSVLHEVPYDPLLPFLFFGEEISMTARSVGLRSTRKKINADISSSLSKSYLFLIIFLYVFSLIQKKKKFVYTWLCFFRTTRSCVVSLMDTQPSTHLQGGP